MKKRRFIAGFLTFVMAIAVFATPLSEYLPVQGNSLTASAAGMSESDVKAKISSLQGLFPAGSYFTVNGKSCGNATPEQRGKHGCSNCNLGNILTNNSKAKNTIVPSVCTGNRRSCYTCVAFARFAFCYIFGHDTNTNTNEISSASYGGVNDTFASALKPGDYLAFFNKSGVFTHAAIFLSADLANNAIYVYDSNFGTSYTEATPLQKVFYNNKKLYSNYSKIVACRSKNYNGTTPTPEPSSRFSVSIDKITANNAIINFVAYKKTTESTKSFSIKVWETNNSSNNKSFSFNSSYPNVGKTQNTGLSFDLKDEVKFSMKHATKYSFTITSNYTENGSSKSYTSSTYSFTTTGSHSYGSWTTTKAATCTSSGTETRKCSCGATETRTIAAKGHKYAASYTIDKYATCTESGSKSRHCTVCGAKTDITTIPATGHDFWGWVTTQEPTCTESGVQTRYCGYCDATETRVVDALGHSYDKIVTVPPTAFSEGYTEYICSRCGQSYRDNIIKPMTVGAVSRFSLITRGTTTLGLSWSKVSGALGYEVQVQKNGKWITAATINSGSTVSCTVKALKAGTYYPLRVRAFAANSDGSIVYSSWKTGSASTAPSGVTGLKLTSRGTNSVKFSWSKNTTASGYQIGIYKGGKWVTYTTTATSYTLKGLSAGTKYSVRVRTYKVINGSRIYSSWKNDSAITFPSNVTGFKLKSKTTSALTLQWNKNVSASGYQIQVKKNGRWLTYTVKGTSSTSYTLKNLAKNTRYSLRIRSYKTIGGSTVYSAWKNGSASTKK